MTQCYICDIDGTVADLTHRLKYIKAKPKDWDAFFAWCTHDKPIVHMRGVLQALVKVAPVLYVSGRPDRLRVPTVGWLTEHKFPVLSWVPFYMRPDGDRRDDCIVKAELLQRLRSDGWEPIMAFDDRDRVVKMWRDNGVPCAQVAPGDF